MKSGITFLTFAAVLMLGLFSVSVASAQSSPPALGPGSACWWPGVNATPSRVFPTPPNHQVLGCVSTDPTASAECWYALMKPTNPLMTAGMVCVWNTTGYWCGTGGNIPPDFDCTAISPAQCGTRAVNQVPNIATNQNCTTPCSTGFIDAGGNCTTPPPKTGKPKEPTNPKHPKCPRCGENARGVNALMPTDPPPGVVVGGRGGIGMSVGDITAMDIGVDVSDFPVGYKPPKGPGAYVGLVYNQKDDGQPGTFGYYNVGPKWSLNTLSFITDDPGTPGSQVQRYAPGGGYVDYVPGAISYNSTTGAFTAEYESHGVLYRIPATGTVTSYELRFPNGVKHVFGLANGASSYPRRMFLTQIVDPQGNAVTLSYDGTFRLTTLTDASGRSTTFSYTNTDPLKLTRVTDPFGRHADFTYNGSGQLASITDVLGIASSFGYSGSYGGYLNALTTPYGTTNFTYYESNPYDQTALQYQSMERTDPLGNTLRAVFRSQSGLAATPSPKPTGMTVSNDYSVNNSFIWDEHAYPLAITKDGSGNVTAEDLSKARLIHWLRNTLGQVSGVAAAKKEPLENYVFYNYPGQPNGSTVGDFDKPTAIGRVLDNGTTASIDKATYNTLGNPTAIFDARSRQFNFAYASNGVDMTTIKQANATQIGKFDNYNSQHLPQTYIDAAAQTWSTAYNTAGQVIYTTNPLNETRFWEYDSYGRVTRVTIPTVVAFASVVYGTTNTGVATAMSYTYDSYDRVATKTDSEGYVLTYTYDALDRVTRITYPDASHDDYDYTFQSGPNAGNPSLELRKSTDRLGRITTYGYDANGRMTSKTEPVSSGVTRTTSYSYYENGVLKELTDANGNVTHWDIDVQGRPTSKTYAYGTAGAKTETYTYENTTSRLKSVTDALGQVKTYTYEKDHRLIGIAYTNSVNTTPNVTFNWDSGWPRLSSMVDGTGTTAFAYVSPTTNAANCAPPGTTTNCGALQIASIDGPVTGTVDKITNTYDKLGRPTTVAISGGSNDTISYDTLGRMATHGTSMGAFSYGYLGNSGQVTSRSLTIGSITTSTSWSYDTNANDRRLTTITNNGVTRSYGLSYLIAGGGGASDPYNIQGITDTAAATHPWATQAHSYAYDLADRLLTASQTTPGNFAFAYDKLDNATTVTKPGSSTVNPTYNANNQMATYGANTYSYDDNGNTLSGDGTKTYKYDAEDRLIEIDYVGGSNKTVFTYDALSHRVAQAETVSGTTTTTNYLWCGSYICQSRNGSNTVLARYHAEGEYIASTAKKYIYMPDQLGSVRDVVDATTGNTVAALDYGPYGNVARTWGSVTPLYQFAGTVYHPASGLNLATYRALDTSSGRWINRDPIREAGGINLYGYARARTARYTDSIGLGPELVLIPIVEDAIIATEGGAAFGVFVGDFWASAEIAFYSGYSYLIGNPYFAYGVGALGLGEMAEAFPSEAQAARYEIGAKGMELWDGRHEIAEGWRKRMEEDEKRRREEERRAEEEEYCHITPRNYDPIER